MANSLGGIPLDADVLWQNEFNHSGVRQAAHRAVDGTLVLQPHAKHKGQKIQLKGNASRHIVRELRALADLGQEHTLLFDGSALQVRFDYAKGDLRAEPWFPLAAPDDTHLYTIELNLLEV